MNKTSATRHSIYLAASALLINMSVPSLSLGQSLMDLTRWEEGRSMRATSNVWVEEDMYDVRNNQDRLDRIEAGETFVLADLPGPGVITHIWMTFLHEPHRWATDGAANHQELLLRIYWDGREKPDIEAPVGEFFANCFGKRMEVISLPVIVEDGDSYNCFWKMPFHTSARIEIVNQSPKPLRKLYYNIDWVKKESLPEDTMYFCAQYRQEYPTRNGEDYLVLDTGGKGYYVGTVLAVRSRSPAWFGEGDEKIYIDGEERPSIRGTGTEDYFLSAWGLKTNSTPYFGVPYLNQHDRIVGQMTCSYRWHIHDPLVFSKGIRVTFETFGWMSADENAQNRAHSWNEREDDYSSVAFWYQMGPTRKFCETPPASERRLPSLERVLVWGRDYVDDPFHGRGEARVQQGARYLESDGQLFFKPDSKEEGWAEFFFEVEEKEPLRLVLELTRSYDYGIYQPVLNGVKLGEPIDLYRPGTDLWEFHIIDFWPEPGPYTLRLECVGKNQNSSNYYLGVNAVRLRERRPRVREFGYDKNKDWRVEQILYR
ncbi:MAG: DUF2961 domain-containing protein [Candidatus Latescibacteria bacterium]|nr:DUF2961 domain-containing protein [Candidatus Latescibacterota bacterium]